MSLTFKPYVELLQMAKEVKIKLMAPIKARAARKRAELEQIKLEEQIANLEESVNKLCTSEDIDFDKLIDLLDSIALKQRRYEQYNTIINQLFPELSDSGE